MSAAWQLALKGHTVDIYEATDKLGGKLDLCIPKERLPRQILEKEVSRLVELSVNLHLNTPVDKKGFDEIYKTHEVVVIACGAHHPRKVSFPGSDEIISAYDFLRDINLGKKPVLSGKKVVVTKSFLYFSATEEALILNGVSTEPRKKSTFSSLTSFSAAALAPAALL